ncbi:hypothetical protein 000TH008_239 [Bacillus phage 000TH008]|nr:hypothetical protein 000TH008_239 [Bacillus phage 000TH008]QQO40932.1 hypothetical protein 000TH009_239 [Bacillus phage 000TH009]
MMDGDKVNIGDVVLLLKDIEFSDGSTLKSGSSAVVTDVREKFGLPYIHPKGYPHERQLQPGDYMKKYWVEGEEQ